MSKKRIYILIIAIGLLLFPLLLSWCLQQEALFPIVGDSVSWLNFWPTYLSAIASLGMIILTYFSLKQNQEQMVKFEKQREEENRARINASIIVHEQAYFLKLKNTGKTDASNVRISVNQEFIDTLPEKNKRIFTDIANPFYIEVGHPVYLYIGWCTDVNEIYDEQDATIKMSGSYYSASVEYSFSQELRLSEFVNKLHFVVRGDLETTMDHIKRRLIVQNDSHHPIQISLENIEKSIITLVREIKEYSERSSSEPSKDDKNACEIEPLSDSEN